MLVCLLDEQSLYDTMLLMSNPFYCRIIVRNEGIWHYILGI